ncbi:MAG: XdhC family protein [Proteobacteria bacterium]|nr:XdhC family protein [Pseudomonadota bacterium]
MKRETLLALNEAKRQGRAIVRASNLSSGEERLIDPATDNSPLGLEAARAARADQSGPVQSESQSWFLGVFNPPLDLVIVGAAHIAQPLSVMAQMAGYGVRIIDPRTAFATIERFPGLPISHEYPDEALAKAPLGSRSALVALTHDPKVDDPALSTALRSPCFYIGALGSKKNHAARLARLKELGFADSDMARIHGPIGLSIGAKSPAEIAVSILAEMTQALRMGSGIRLPSP